MSESQSPSPTEALPTVVKLSRPVPVLDGSVSEFSLRDPTGLDLSVAGYPVKYATDGSGGFDTPAMTRMIARLAGVPLTAAQSLRASDWTACAAVIAGFLPPGADASS